MVNRNTSNKHDYTTPVALSDRHAAWLSQQLHYLLSAIRNGTFVANDRIGELQLHDINRELSCMQAELDSVFLATGMRKLPGPIHLSRIMHPIDHELRDLDALLDA